MSRMNYAKVTMQKRIASESYSYDRAPLFFDKPRRPQQIFWVTMLAGKHRGKALPVILLEDPTYVTEYLYSNAGCFEALLKECPSPFERKRAHQLRVLANRAQNILVPNGKRDTHEFAILKDRNGVFAGVMLVRKGSKIPHARLRGGRTVAFHRATLNLSTPERFKNPVLGRKRMKSAFVKLFFPLDKVGPDGDAINQFFANGKNFELSNFKTHTSLVMTKADSRALRIEYRRSAKLKL